MQISNSLLEKYNQAVPRYTSYPPANYFTDSFTGSDYAAMLNDSNNGQPEHVAFYLHIPFCKKICLYCGCNACTLGKGLQLEPYIDALKKELGMVASRINKTRKVSQIHYGGGTPNAIPVQLLQELNAYLFAEFDFLDDAEIAIECNPAYLDPTYIAGLHQAGFNRFSLGIQDFNVDVLKGVNREPSAMPHAELIAALRSGGDRVSVNLDFIYGLPGQHLAGFQDTISKAIALQPDRLVTFSYAHVPWLKKHQEALEKKGLPGPNQKMEMFLAGYQLLRQSGYEAIGFDHFVKPTDELFHAQQNGQLHRNFQGYCTRRTTGQVYAVGVSGISQLAQGYAQNTKDIAPYIQAINKGGFAIEKGYQLQGDDATVRAAINQLMCNKQLHIAQLATELGLTPQAVTDTLAYTPEQFAGFAEDGLISLTDDGFLLLEKGSFFTRNLAAQLDPAFKQATANRYSQSV